MTDTTLLVALGVARSGSLACVHNLSAVLSLLPASDPLWGDCSSAIGTLEYVREELERREKKEHAKQAMAAAAAEPSRALDRLVQEGREAGAP